MDSVSLAEFGVYNKKPRKIFEDLVMDRKMYCGISGQKYKKS